MNIIEILAKKLLLRFDDKNIAELLRGSAIALGAKILGIASTYIFTFLVTRSLGASIMGAFSISLTVLSIFSILGRMGLDTALLRFFGEYFARGEKALARDTYLKSLKISLISSFTLSALLYFCSKPLAVLVFRKSYLEHFFHLTSLAILPMVILIINTESLRGLKKIKDYSILQLVAPYLLGVTILVPFLLFLHKSPTIPLVAYFVGLYISAFISIYRLFRFSGFERGKKEHSPQPNTRQILGVSLPMMTTSSLSMLMKWTDIIMLGIFSTSAEVGIYSVAVKISSIASIMLFAINSIAAPKFAEFYGRKDKKNLAMVARKSTILIFYSTLPIIAMLLLFPSSILGIFGSDFKDGSAALIILILGQFANAFCGSVGYILQMTGHQKNALSILFQASLINIVLNAILIPGIGMNGAAIASTASMVYWNIFMLITIKKKLGFLTLFFIPEKQN